jgi:hypothetical protein
MMKRFFLLRLGHAFLLLADTGTIVAEGDAIRGESLAPAIEKFLAKHN